MKSKKIAFMGLLTALAMIFSYIEFLIPISIGIPGIKLGLANIVVVTALYVIKPQEAFLINVVRILLVGLLFGNSMSLIYSLAGGLLSPMLGDDGIAMISAVGGYLLIMLSLSLLEIRKIKTGNFLPALVFAPILLFLFSYLPI